MTSHVLATKVWQKASKENCRLILDNASFEDVQILTRDNDFKTIDGAYNCLVAQISEVLSFREVQKRKNEKS